MPNVVWNKDAESALAGVPLMLREIVRLTLEERVRSQGSGTVTLNDFQEGEVRFRPAMAGKSRGETPPMTPRENAPGVEMVIIDVCRNESSGCPNALIPTGDWKRAIEDWIRKENVSERLRMRVKGGRILHHHKLRISISGCPNGCSRPQIADVGLVGFVRPAVAIENCTACGTCEAACPDKAIAVDGGPPEFDRTACQGCVQCRNACPAGCITLSRPGVRILLGGKLGRHPRFAEMAGEASEPSALIQLLDQVIGSYIEHAEPEERFAGFLLRKRTNSVDGIRST